MIREFILINQVTGPLFIDIANAYAKKFDNVTLVTGSIEPASTKLDINIKIVKKCNYIRKKGYLRILTWLVFFFQTFIYLFLKSGKCKILLVSNPPILPFFTSIFSFRKKFEFNVIIYDLYPDALNALNYIRKDSIMFKSWKKINSSVYKKASRVFTISNTMAKILSKTCSSDKIEVVYPWVDVSFIKPIKKDENWFLEKYKLKNKKIILYSGNMGATHDLMTILFAANELKSSDKDYHFIFIGDGVLKNELQSFKSKNSLSNVTFLPYQNYSVLPFSFASADFGVVSLGRGLEGLSIPSKTFYYLASGCALISISESDSEVNKLVRENDCGYIIEPGNYVKLIKDLKSVNANKLTEMKNNSRYLSKNFTNINANQFL